MTTQAPFFLQNNATIAQLALEHRLPSISGEPNAAEAGARVFYGPSIIEGCQRAAYYVDGILKGAKPADLPVEQPMKFKLVINLKTAQALGITLSPVLLLQADEVIKLACEGSGEHHAPSSTENLHTRVKNPFFSPPGSQGRAEQGTGADWAKAGAFPQALTAGVRQRCCPYSSWPFSDIGESGYLNEVSANEPRFT